MARGRRRGVCRRQSRLERAAAPRDSGSGLPAGSAPSRQSAGWSSRLARRHAATPPACWLAVPQQAQNVPCCHGAGSGVFSTATAPAKERPQLGRAVGRAES